MHPSALLFDLDGTLIDSDPIHAEVYIDLFAERGRTIDADFYFANIHGRHNTEIFGEHFPEEDANRLHLYKEAAYRDRLADRVPPIPGASALLDWAEARSVGVAVVTNAPRANANASLGAIGLADRFGIVVIGEECSAGKPDPAPYAEALRQLNVSADNALAFEDSPSGIKSAVGAGIRTIGLKTSIGASPLRTAGASHTIDHFEDIALDEILGRSTGALT